MPQEQSNKPIPREQPFVPEDIAVIRKALDSMVIPGYVHKAPSYDILAQSSMTRQEQIEHLGAEVAERVVTRHTPIPRRPTL